MKIERVLAREILDSRGNPTIETKVVLENGVVGKAAVPSGASVGLHEARELRDGGNRYGGKGVLKAVKHVNTTIFKALKGQKIADLNKIDRIMIELDGTPAKSKLGANAILSVSLAATRAGAAFYQLPLYKYIRELFNISNEKFKFPLLGMNILNGGRHARNNLSVQEFMIIPHHRSCRERVRIGAEVFHILADLLAKNNYFTGVGDEGGFSPDIPNNLHDNEKAIQLIIKAIKKAGYTLGKDVYLGLDVAASEFYNKENYYFIDKEHGWSTKQMISLLSNWVDKYSLMFIEDGLAQDDWEGWQLLTSKLGKKISLVGDDLFVTNKERLQKGIDMRVANTVLIKPNQIGTLSETIDTILLAKKSDYKIFISHRSGDTADTFIADLAVAVNADYMKTGSLSRSERTEKYNRLMEIELELS